MKAGRKEQGLFLVCIGLITCCQMFNNFKDMKVLHAKVLKVHQKILCDRQKLNVFICFVLKVLTYWKDFLLPFFSCGWGVCSMLAASVDKFPIEFVLWLLLEQTEAFFSVLPSRKLNNVTILNEYELTFSQWLLECNHLGKKNLLTFFIKFTKIKLHWNIGTGFYISINTHLARKILIKK